MRVSLLVPSVVGCWLLVHQPTRAEACDHDDDDDSADSDDNDNDNDAVLEDAIRAEVDAKVEKALAKVEKALAKLDRKLGRDRGRRYRGVIAPIPPIPPVPPLPPMPRIHLDPQPHVRVGTPQVDIPDIDVDFDFDIDFGNDE